MKKFNLQIILIIASIMVLIQVSLVSANLFEEGCFIEIKINEEISQNQDSIQLELESLESIHGQYASRVYGSGGTYELKTYASSNNLLGTYAGFTSLLRIGDTFDSTIGPEILFHNSSTTTVTIPYQAGITKITVVSNGTETDLGINPEEIQCEITCKQEGQTGLFSEDRCCLGLNEIPISKDRFSCSSCGNGICSGDEDQYSCPSDCERHLECEEGYEKTSYGCEPTNECYDSDGNLGFFKSLFKKGSVIYEQEFHDDVCIDDSTVQEYYCGINFGWAFWNLFDREIKYSTETCEEGCYNGACLPIEEEEETEPEPPANSEGIVSYWKLDGNLEDEVGGNNGEGYSILETDGIFSQAYGFNSSLQSRIELSENTLDKLEDFTLSLYVKLGSESVQGALYSEVTEIGRDNGATLRLTIFGNFELIEFGNLFAQNSIVYNGFNGELSLSDGKWHHLAITKDDNEQKLFIDGSEIPSNGNNVNSSLNFRTADYAIIGASYYFGSNGYFFDGEIDDIRIYNRALSQSEIGDLAGDLFNLPPEPEAPTPF